MAFEELDDLLNGFAEADRQQLKDILGRNADAASQLSSRESVYKAFVDGDTAEITRITGGNKTTAATTAATTSTTSTTTSAALDAAALDARLSDFRTNIFNSPEFSAAVDTRAKTLAETMVKEAENRAVARSAYLSSEIYEIMDSHRTEFGKNLDRAGFEKFVTDHPGMTSLRAAHDAFVSEERLEARAQKRATEIVAAKQTSDVPGTSLPTATTPLGQMIRANAKAVGAGEGARGTAIDSAVKAFRELQTGRTQ